MNIGVVSLFPELIDSNLRIGVVGAALNAGLWTLTVINPRQFTHDPHKTVDDRPFGGRDGMLMLAEPLAQAVSTLTSRMPDARVVHLSPRGRLFTDQIARSWAREGRDLVLVATRYAGVDNRFVSACCDDELSIGDYVVSGGEWPALVVIDAVLRHRHGVLGCASSAELDSFGDGMLETAQYTRPREWRERGVPAALISGDPKRIEAFEWVSALAVTITHRPDLAAMLDRTQLKEKWSRLRKWIDSGDPLTGTDVSCVEAWLGEGLA